jgi:hypothetical protein
VPNLSLCYGRLLNPFFGPGSCLAAGEHYEIEQAVEDVKQFDAEEKVILNRFRYHQQVLFLSSDIMDAGGREVDSRYLQRRPINEQLSHLIFPIENPPKKHLLLWKQAVMAIKRRAGKFNDKSFKIWDYRYDEDKMQILHLKGKVMDVYTKSLVPRYSTRSNCFTRSRRRTK